MLPVWARLSGGPWCGLVTASLYSTAADAVRPAYCTGRARSRGAYFTSLPARSRVGIRPSHSYWSLSSLYVALVWDCEWLKRIIHTCLSLCRFSYCHKFCIIPKAKLWTSEKDIDHNSHQKNQKYVFLSFLCVSVKQTLKKPKISTLLCTCPNSHVEQALIKQLASTGSNWHRLLADQALIYSCKRQRAVQSILKLPNRLHAVSLKSSC